MAWSLLPEQERAVVGQVAQGHWAPAIELLLTEAREVVRASVALLAADSLDPALASAAASLITDSSQVVSEHAERALVAMAAAAPTDPRVRAAVTAAASTIASHHRRGPLLAFAAMADRVSLRQNASEPWAATARALLRGDEVSSHDKRSETSRAVSESLRAIIRFSRAQAVSERATEWLAHPALARACADRLARPRVRSDHVAVLQNTHLFENPARAMAIRAIKLPAFKAARKGESAILPMDVMDLDEDARANFPRVASLIKAQDADLTAWSEALLNDPSARVRLSLAHHAPLALRQDLVHDAHPLIARASAIRLSRAGTLSLARAEGATPGDTGADEDRWSVAKRSPHATVRALAHDERACFGPMGLNWRLSWCRRMRLSEDACLSHIGAMLRQGGSALDEAIELLRVLGLATRLHAQAGEALRSAKPTPRQAANIVALLGHADPSRSIGAIDVIASALEHEDARVRANAIEAMAHRRRRATFAPATPVNEAGADLSPLLDDAHHRVRSTLARAVLLREVATTVEVKRSTPDPSLARAIKGDQSPAVASADVPSAPRMIEITPKDAQGVLSTMLTACEPLDRLAGVWAAGRVVLVSARESSVSGGDSGAPLLQARLAEMARFDAEPKVRWRASCVIERIEGDLRASWSRPHAARSREEART